MDDNGFVYDKNGEVVNTLDLNQYPATSNKSIGIQAVDGTILGSNTGAFARQVTPVGYKGIRTTIALPSSPDGYKIEGGVQYSNANNNYTAIIRPKGLVKNAIPENTGGVLPARYLAGTSLISNLLYDATSSQFKYFVNGTTAGGSQYIYFYYTKSLTSTEQSYMCVKRVTALAKENYTGTNIEKVTVTYSGTEVTQTNGTTANLATLSSHVYNGKTFGTSDTPASTITKSGSLPTQTIKIDTTNLQ
ncbi:hypothetical protein [Paenibacillus sp. CMAA1364]